VSSPGEINEDELEGLCTILKVEFVGWTAAEVRSVIGESGTGWCAIEEFWHDEEPTSGMLSEVETDSDGSLFSPRSTSPTFFDMGMSTIQDPASSFVMPTLDISGSTVRPSEPNPFAEEMESSRMPLVLDYDDPWSDDDMSEVSSPSLSRVSSSSSLGLVINPPSENGWHSSGFSNVSETLESYEELDPRESLF